jgi:hypothetical protein
MQQRVAFSPVAPVRAEPNDWRERKLREWLLLRLRLAGTRDTADEVLAILQLLGSFFVDLVSAPA